MKLSSGRILICPLSKRDIPQILEMYLEIDAFKYVKPFQNKSSEFYFDFLNKKLNSDTKEVELWTVRKKEDNTFIGTANLSQFASTSMIQIGCHIKKNNWSKGYASETLTEILTYGTEIKKLNEIFGVFELNNIASKKILEKLNFKFSENKIFFETEVNVYKYSV
ncbi:MAG: hypothetical protein COA88_07075 [Kordia sp.]|nr:MAG: hypothetical protein COA88_07075 [Kordia sp.]